MRTKQSNVKLIVASIISAAILSSTSSAQQISKIETQQAAEAMRAAGQSEEQVRQFLDAMEQINAVQIPTSPEGASQASDIQAVTGFSNKEIKIVAPIAGAIKSKQDQEIEGWLAEEARAFEERFADKPNISASFDGAIIHLKLIDCRIEDAYTISAQAAPTEHNRSGITIGASRGWSVMGGAWKAGIGVQIGGENYRADLPNGEFTQPVFTYDGPVVSKKSGIEKHLRFEAECPR